MIDEDLSMQVLLAAQNLGATWAEARLEHTTGSTAVMKNSTPQLGALSNTNGIGIRFLINNTVGFVSMNNPTKSAVKSQLVKCIRYTKSARNTAEQTLFAPRRATTWRQRVRGTELSLEESIDTLTRVDKALAGIGVPGKFFQLSYARTKKFYADTDGVRIYSDIPRVQALYHLTVKQGQRSSQRYWQLGNTGGTNQARKWNLPEHVHTEVRAMQQVLKHGKALKKGKYDVVVGPEISGIAAHEACGHPFEADRILGKEAAQAGESFITRNDINTQLGSPQVSVVDNPLIPWSYGYILYDDEGCKGKKKYLLKNGRIHTFLHNRQTAPVFQTVSNGCARAEGFTNEPLIRMSNTYIEPGTFSEEELIEGITNGLYMKNFTEWNIDDTRYQQKYVGLECYKIEQGSLTTPVRDPVLEITTPHLYRSIDACGKNLQLHAAACGKGEPLQSMPVTIGGPAVRLRGVYIR